MKSIKAINKTTNIIVYVSIFSKLVKYALQRIKI